MSALRVMSPPIRTNSHHPTLASAQSVVEDQKKSLKISSVSISADTDEPPSRLAQQSLKTMAGRAPLAPTTRGAKRITAGEPPGECVRKTCSESSVLGTQ